MFILLSRWIGVRLDLMSFAFIAVVAYTSIALRDELGAGDIGLVLSYAIQLTAIFQWCIRQVSSAPVAF